MAEDAGVVVVVLLSSLSFAEGLRNFSVVPTLLFFLCFGEFDCDELFIEGIGSWVY